MILRSVSDRTPSNETRWQENINAHINDPSIDKISMNSDQFIIKSDSPGNYYFFIGDEGVAFYEGFVQSDKGIETKMIFTKKGRFRYSLMYFILKWILSKFNYIKTGMVTSTDAMTFLTKNFDNFIKEGYTFSVIEDNSRNPEIPLTDIKDINKYASFKFRIKIYPPKS